MSEDRVRWYRSKYSNTAVQQPHPQLQLALHFTPLQFSSRSVIKESKMSSDDCLPGPLKDFIFDLHDSVRTSQIPAEQLTLYTGSFRELTSKVSTEINTS